VGGYRPASFVVGDDRRKVWVVSVGSNIPASCIVDVDW